MEGAEVEDAAAQGPGRRQVGDYDGGRRFANVPGRPLGAEGLVERGLEGTSTSTAAGEGCLLFLLLVGPALIVSRPVAAAAAAASSEPDSARADAARCLQTQCRTRKGSGVDSRHPDARLVDLEEVCDQRVEVDVGVGEVVECQFLPIPGVPVSVWYEELL